MRLMMVSGDRQVTVGEQGPFYAMQREFSRYFERIDVLCPRPPARPTITTIHDNVHFHPANVGRSRMVRYVVRRGRELLAEHGHGLIVSHDYGWFYNGVGSARLSDDRHSTCSPSTEWPRRPPCRVPTPSPGRVHDPPRAITCQRYRSSLRRRRSPLPPRP